MDKRWIIIFIILIVGISSLYYITTESMRLGKAIDTIDNVIITLPTDFKIGEKTQSFAEIMNRNTDERIDIQLIKEKNKANALMKQKLQNLRSEDVTDVKNYTQNLANITTYTISYQNVTDEEHPMNYTVNFINKLNKTFVITTYNYNNNASQLEDLTYVIDTIRLDYKVKDK